MVDNSKIKIVSPVVVKVLLKSWIKSDKEVLVHLSNESLKEIVKLFKNKTFGPTPEDLYRIVYEDMEAQGYDLREYFIRDVEVVDDDIVKNII